MMQRLELKRHPNPDSYGSGNSAKEPVTGASNIPIARVVPTVRLPSNTPTRFFSTPTVRQTASPKESAKKVLSCLTPSSIIKGIKEEWPTALMSLGSGGFSMSTSVLLSNTLIPDSINPALAAASKVLISMLCYSGSLVTLRHVFRRENEKQGFSKEALLTVPGWMGAGVNFAAETIFVSLGAPRAITSMAASLLDGAVSHLLIGSYKRFLNPRIRQ